MTSTKIPQLAVVAAATLGILGFASFGAQAQNSATQSVTASIVVQQGITLTENVALDFGIVVSPNSAGTTTFTITPGDDTVVASGTGGGVVVSGGNDAQFTVTGDTGAAVSIAFLTTDSCSGATGIDWAAVNPLTDNWDGIISAASTESFDVGGAIDVDFEANTSDNPVTCAYDITASYN